MLAKKVRRDNEKKEVDNIIHNNNVMRDEEEKKEDINVLTKSILEWNKESEDLKNNKDSVAGLVSSEHILDSLDTEDTGENISKSKSKQSNRQKPRPLYNPYGRSSKVTKELAGTSEEPLN